MNAPRVEQSFYASALTAAERDDLAEARGVEGLEDEVALLRLRLREALTQHPEDIRLIESGAKVLIQSLLAQHRLSPKQADGICEAVAAFLEEFGAVMRGPEV
jgi:hypothetical protein